MVVVYIDMIVIVDTFGVAGWLHSYRQSLDLDPY